MLINSCSQVNANQSNKELSPQHYKNDLYKNITNKIVDINVEEKGTHFNCWENVNSLLSIEN